MINANDGIKFNKTIDPHEEQFLDLPELNKQQIDDNKYSILQNRIMIITGCVLAVSIAVGSFIILDNKLEVSIHECEDRLYEKITGNKIHRDMFEEN